jgi:signal transduction histidine kinase/ligand-binding sensor domain-containing protein
MLFVVLAPLSLTAEKLPIKSYTTADGLAHNTIMRIRRDSHGFLWFCTLRGLSRFDGYSFTNYGAEQGLRGQIRDVLETHDGEYWVASLNGLYRFNPLPFNEGPRHQSRKENSHSGHFMFVPFRLTADETVEGINALREDENGTIWVGTNAGLYRLTRSANTWAAELANVSVLEKPKNNARIYDLFEDHDGAMWVTLPGNGARRLLPNGRIDNYTAAGVTARHTSGGGDIWRVFEDHSHQIWLATDHGVSVLERGPYPAFLKVRRTYTIRDGLSDDEVQEMFETMDGTLWVGTAGGLNEFCVGENCGGKTFHSYTSSSLGRFGVTTMADDRDGNLWMANDVGALRLARDGFTTYDEADGFRSTRVFSVAEDLSRHLYVVSEGRRRADINQFLGNRFRSVSPHLPRSDSPTASLTRQPAVQDKSGDWWVGTDYGLVHYPQVNSLFDLATAQPIATYNNRNGLPFPPNMNLYPDRSGNMWIGSIDRSTGNGGLTEWSRKTRTLQTFGASEGLRISSAPASFCEDDSGSLWIGFLGSSLARYRNGRFSAFTVADGLPPGSIWSIYVDHLHRVWVATTEGGAARIDDPAQEHPQFKTFSTGQGLSSSQIQAITEDELGRMYFLTDRGLDRLDLETGSVKHFSSADGLVNTSHWGVAFRDHTGTLWFGTLQGLSRLKPKPIEPASTPAVRISSIRVRGKAYPVSELGETQIANLVLQSDENDLQVDFAGFNFGVGEVLRYQYKLEGATQDWSAPTEQRSINFATLSPGRYKFLVRGMNWKGEIGTQVAEINFRVLPPIWQRWWFLAGLAAVIAAALYSLYRSRMKRMLELERVRTRIATDLHDDIGSNLTRISILSEVMRQRVGSERDPVDEPLVRIADLSRELIDSMGDIVWAVNPKRDYVGDLVHRMRHFATEILSNRNIVFDFRAAEMAHDKELRTDKRRQIFLIFKEALNNIVRHSGCKRVTIGIEADKNHFNLTLGDDGRGFDKTQMNGNQGHGLQSMAERAKSLNAEFAIDSRVGEGTTLVLRVPI